MKRFLMRWSVAYAQKNIIERYERADRERHVALEANNELWRGYVREQRKEIGLAAKNGTKPPLFLPHPDDVVIDPDRGVIFRGLAAFVIFDW